jgi:hypothetical protein
MKTSSFTPRLSPAAALLIAVASTGCGAVSTSEAQPVAPATVAGRAWFVQTGCTACHSVSVYGLYNLTGNAPDLSVAVEDVPKRFGRSLEDFLRAPTGTMEMVLSSRISLTDRQRTVAIERLHEAYRQYKTAAGSTGLMPSH